MQIALRIIFMSLFGTRKHKRGPSSAHQSDSSTVHLGRLLFECEKYSDKERALRTGIQLWILGILTLIVTVVGSITVVAFVAMPLQSLNVLPDEVLRRLSVIIWIGLIVVSCGL